jgi:hypothetical protein
MDRKLKAILDEFLPYTDAETKFGEESKKNRQEKFELRKKLANAIVAYKHDEIIELPGLNIDIVEVMKKMRSDN